MTRIRTLEFLPSIFQTPTNSQFLGATLDQLVNPPVTRKIDGFIGSKLGYGINALDYYVTEPTKTRKDYQLEPGVVFTKTNESVAKDFISYPGILDALELQNGITTDNDRLFTSQFYSWDSFTNLDMIINYNQYYWLPEGPPAVTVAASTVFQKNDYIVTSLENVYSIKAVTDSAPKDNPTITLLRGGTYTFLVDQDSQFWIQGKPGISGYDPLQTNLYVRDIYGVTNNGANIGAIVFNVPQKNAQDNLNYPGNNLVDVVSTIPYSTLDGATLNDIGSIDGVTALDGRTVMFYNTGESVPENNYFYTISFSGLSSNPTINLTQLSSVPVEEKITPQYGTTYINIPFVKTLAGVIEPIPYISAPLDTLYYQDGTNPNKVGIIKLIESNDTNTLNIDTSIIGKTNYASPNGITFTNGLKVIFDGDVIPTSYLQGEYYVQGVGTAIELIPTSSLITPEPYTDATSLPYDSLPFDIGTYDAALYIPLNADYITIARNSINRNPWSRSNRWFHIQVIQDTAEYLNNPEIITTYASVENKAKRPIIEFYPNLRLYNTGTIAKNAVDFIDNRTTNAFEFVAGQSVYYPDVETYTSYTGSILSNQTIESGFYIPGQQYSITRLDTTDVATWQNIGSKLEFDGGFTPGLKYIITDLGTGTDWNQIAGTRNTFATELTVGVSYTITSLGTTTQAQWNTLAGTIGVTYNVTDTFTCAATITGSSTGTVNVNYNVGDIITAVNPGETVGSGSGSALTVLFTTQNSGNYNSNEFTPDTEYFISTVGNTLWDSIRVTPVNFLKAGLNCTIASLGTTNWNAIGYIGVPVVGGTFTSTGAGTGTGTVKFTSTVRNCFTWTNVSSLQIGRAYVITDLGNTPQEEWNIIAGTTDVVYTVGTRFKCYATSVTGTTGQAGVEYYIQSLGVITQRRWNDIMGTTNESYNVGDLVVPKNAIPGISPTGVLLPRQITTADSTSVYKTVGTGFAYQGFGLSLSQTTTTITIDANDVVGNFATGMYINDQILNAESQLPPNTRILDFSVSENNVITLSVFWSLPTIITGTYNNASFVANIKNNIDLSLFSGARVVFAAEENLSIRNKIYVANFSNIGSTFPVITLTEAVDGDMEINDQFVVLRGENNQGSSFYWDGENYVLAQAKPGINIQPKFDIFDKNGISFSDQTIYESSSFVGCELFRYKVGTGISDSILGFPLTYSSINNVGDITFEVALNSDTFNYVSSIGQNEPIVQNVNTGFVHNGIDRTEYTLLTGWQTAVAPSVQYQVFEFEYTPNVPPVLLDSGETITYTVTCDVGALSRTETIWPNLQVLNNNEILVENTDYTVTYDANETTINVFLNVDAKTVIQVLVLSDQVSQNAYYSIPINLSNNPFNTDVTTVDIGDIRGHYQTIFYNNPNALGTVFGSNNTRDLGNIVPYGTRIIQNSASLVLPGAFLRNNSHNLFEALEYNSREYIKFKTLLVDTVNKTSYDQKFDPAYILDDALDQITSVKNQDMPFFWSDMLPSKAPYITNTYTVYNTVLTSTYPLSKIYNFTSANYDGILVYLQTKIDGVDVVKLLYKNIDYTISTDSPSVTVTRDIIKGDKIIIKEYNQTYGSYVPNTPSKLGLYPVSIPSVVLDTSYSTPTYFIIGHDGSHTKLYGDYYPATNTLVDFRDQALLEFETRIYNNIKLSGAIPIQEANLIPGYFRNTPFSYDEWLRLYSPQFLNWIGQNRLDYKTQLYLSNDPWTYNYTNSQNKLDGSIVSQGYWRGFYQYYYDTSTPDTTPWQMIGYANKPTWWENRYGPAPYTSDNLILWTDLQNGYDYNDGVPVVREQYIRPGLLNILPVNDQGELLEPFYTIIGNYNSNTLRRSWVVGDDSPVEFSYRRSSSYPFDMMRLYALMQPANFYNLCVDLDNYKYDAELNQYLFNGRSHLVPNQIQIYGNGTAKTSYINWIVDYEKQLGIGATEKIQTLLNNLDVRLVYRVAGFSDKTTLKFFVEKGSPESRNASLLIPDESYSILLYENQPYDRLAYSSVVIQLDPNGYRVYGNSQSTVYFSTLKPIFDGKTSTITVQDQTVSVANNYSDRIEYVPYGTLFYTTQELSQFIMSYGRYLESQGAIFNQIESGIELNWQQMIAEFLYWSQVGWEIGSIVTLNPAAETIHVNKESTIVQPLTLQQTNFILNQNLYPIANKDLAIFRDGSEFKASALNVGDTISYAQFNMSNIEHGIVFDNTTLFNDVIYNLISGLKQNRIYVRGTKSAEWNGTLFASGFIYNQDNIQEYTGNQLYTKGAIVKYKNKYWSALKIIQPTNTFNELDWKQTDYDEIQKGLLPNSSTRSYESALYYNVDKANLESDADQLSFSLIGFRPRPYMASADLTDITQVNVYKNMIKEKGTRNTLNAFKNAQLPQGGIDYNIYENWAILSGEFGGVLNNNFVEFKLNESKLTGNPGIVGLTNGNDIEGAEQLVPIYSLFNYGRPVTNTEVLPTLPKNTPNILVPDAGYVNLNDVKMSAYFYSDLAAAVDKNNLPVSINDFYVNDYVWLANYLSTWQIFTPFSIGQVLQVRSNLNDTSTVFFEQPHNLTQFSILSIVNFDDLVNGYYIVDQIINPYQVIINLTLPSGVREVTGQGIAMGFNNARVDQPSDIQNLPLLNYEFTKNKVWVDTNTDGNWGVYRKSINYNLEKEIVRPNSVKFGSAVNYTSSSDFLISDAPEGKVYRYQYDPLTNEYNEDQLILGGESFGTTIVSAQNITAISNPFGATTNDRYVQIRVVNDTFVTDDIILYQRNLPTNTLPYITAPTGCTNFGTGLAISDDTNYIFISDFDENSSSARNKVQVYRKNNIEIPVTSISVQQTYQIVEVGTTDFTDLGAVENKVGIYFIALPGSIPTGTGVVRQTNYQFVYTINSPNTSIEKFGHSISTNYNGDIVVIGAPEEDIGSIENAGKTYVYQRLIQNFEVQTSAASSSFTLSWTPDNTKPLSVYINGTFIQASNYTLSGATLTISTSLLVGDIVTVGGNEFVLSQILTNTQTSETGARFGYSVDNNNYGTEILVGAPFDLTTNTVEGAVYRYTYGSERFGYITGVSEVDVTTSRTLLINGFAVTIPAGNGLLAAQAINNAGITNIQASVSNNILQINIINNNIAEINQKLTINAVDADTFAELGLQLFTNTQTILSPHQVGPTQFGTVVKFNEYNSVVISAPTATRYALTTFDFTDDENLDNDTIFDNNATQFLDTFKNAGAVYMYDYLENYNENLNNIGAYTYAQSCNAQNIDYGQQPYYGTALDFSNNIVVIGTPNYRPNDFDGQVITYVNETGIQNWEVYRQSSPIVDINRVQNMQLFSAETNDTLINLDYMDPLQGKLLGAIAENIDIISNTDPANYNNENATQSGFVWGADNVGTLWYDTTNVRYINYHQNDNVYNSKYWGALFPGSNIAVYTWVASTDAPAFYTGPGTPKDISLYTVQTIVNASNAIQPVYYFWVRNTQEIVPGKSLSDSTLQEYIANPIQTGISYLTPILPDAFALYNVQSFLNANDTVLHIGYSTGTKDDPAHQEYCLIREDYASDFLPGIPNINKAIDYPQSLYNQLLNSLSGANDLGAVVPNPYLPKAVQSGVLPRPVQSFFYNRYDALKNYLQYVNSVLSLFPITELRRPTFLNTSGTYYDTTNFWQYVNWWAEGYNNNTKSVMQVEYYADLSVLNVPKGTIVTVNQNNQGLAETYIYEDNGVWTRIGLQNGTIEFKSDLYNYNAGKFGFGGDFFSTTPFDQYPSEETRYIVRAINEQIFTDEFLIYRNKGLIILFQYIQAETVENQNYLPWLNKTSLVDVSHTIRELLPLQNYVSDNQEFLAGYVNEAKPYHVVIKEFLFDYKGTDIYQGNITDFDLPATYDEAANKFISPQLVYQNARLPYEFLDTDSVWQKSEYNQWFNNYGLSLTGIPNYALTKLASYVTLASDFLVVDNASGFPTNGVIKIADIANPDIVEYIGYANVDRVLNTLSGLSRGLYESTVFDHIPGENIFIDLPPVIVLDGGRNYFAPPKVIARIDTTKYPAPREEALLEAVMGLDSVLQINVINPGSGYAVNPEIVVDPAEIYEFTNSDVDILNNNIQIYAPTLSTGDIVKYVTENTPVGGLDNNQYYYVGTVSNNGTSLVSLYTTYRDAVFDTNRVKLQSTGSGTQTFEIGAIAIAISSSYPVRENNITIRFDRTSYNSQVQDWTPGNFYGSSFAGSFDLQDIASSPLKLFSNFPNINNILASNGGFILPIESVGNEKVTDWSEFTRTIANTISGSNTITLSVVETTDNASGSTIGFTIGMPIKFTGNVGTSGLVEYDIADPDNTTYYISEIINETQFKVVDKDDIEPTLSNYTATELLNCYTGKITNTAIISTIYPGIRPVTASSALDNSYFSPLTAIGTGGTNGLYTGIPIWFTGNVFGGISENSIYYVTSVLDNQRFTINENNNPLTLKVLGINLANQLILETDVGLSVNDRVVFNNMTIDGIDVLNFGGIEFGVIYYVKEIGINVITLSETLGGAEKSLSTIAFSASTYAYFTSQEDNIVLSTDSGDMKMSIQAPISPGQVNGKPFTFYQTSQQFADKTGTIGNLVQQTIAQSLSSTNIIAFDGNISRLYTGLPIRVANNAGVLRNDLTYYMDNVGYISLDCAGTNNSSCTINTSILGTTMTVVLKTGSGNLYPGSVISGTGLSNSIYIVQQLTGTPGGLGTYEVSENFISLTILTGLTANTGYITLAVTNNTDEIYVGMPITFNGLPVEDQENSDARYYVRDIIDSSSFVISLEPTGPAEQLVVYPISFTGTGSASAQLYLQVPDLIDNDEYYIRTLGTTSTDPAGGLGSWNNLGATFVYPGSFVNDVEYIITNEGSTNWEMIGAPANATVGTVFTASFSGTDPTNPSSTGIAMETYFVKNASAIGVGTGTAIVVQSDTSMNNIFTQYITDIPEFDVSYILGGYRVSISDGGAGFTVNNTITISGVNIGGTTPNNDLTITVDQIDSVVAGEFVWSLPIESNGTITKVIVTGTPNEISNTYYLKVLSANSFKVYSDSQLTIPVSGLTLPYEGFTETNATLVISGTDYVTVVDSTIFNINDPVVFTGDIFTTDITLGQVYYIYDKPNSTSVRITTNPGSATNIVNFTVGGSGSMLMSKSGSFAYLQEPFYFEPSIVKYNNRVYVCVISNNDDDFVFGKWELLNSGDRRLNALDRAVGYYQPSANMPGLDLQQLFTGITYPNTTYKGNAFDPAEQYSVDTILQDQVFYPTNINIPAIVFQGVNYFAPANLPNYSAFIADIEVTDDWLLAKIADKPLSLTDLILENNKYVMTSSNSATPIMISTDSKVWSANGYFVPYGTTIDEIPFVKIKLIASQLSLNAVAYGNGKYVAVGTNIITTDNLALWRETYIFNETSSSVGNLYGVQYVDNDVYTGWIAVGERDGVKIILFSSDAEIWDEVSAGSFIGGNNNTLKSIAYNESNIIVVGNSGVCYNATSMTNWVFVTTGSSNNLNDIIYADGTFVTVGDNHTIARSSSGSSWIAVSSPATENLNAVHYLDETSTWTIVGDNNTVLQTTDIASGAVVWDTTQIFSAPNPAYTIQGDPFQAGYGPEELVPGVVTDQLTMIVNTRPGTNWPAYQYAHVGYETVSIELDANIENLYSFADVVEVPAQIGVFLLINNLSKTLYIDEDYIVDWINKTVTLNTNISSPDQLRIDVYEVGNGDQLVKSSTDNDPITTNVTSGFDEIYINANYAGQRIYGSGIVKPDTLEYSTATQTFSSDNTILVTNIAEFTLNGQIEFTGTVFGGILVGTTYFVKSISAGSSKITISNSLENGIAGPVVELSNASGSMVITLSNGPGEFYSAPAVYRNGSLLVPGRTNIVLQTSASTNSILTYTTIGLLANQKIVFGDGITGGLTPHVTYYIKTVDQANNTFTVSSTLGGSVVILTNGAGSAIFVTEDYAPAVTSNGITAKIIFAQDYDQSIDYISYSFLGETEPAQYGYTIPQTQVITSNGGVSYNLSNYINEENATNAMVEVDGLRIIPGVDIGWDDTPYDMSGWAFDSNYVINQATNTIDFDVIIPESGKTIAVTTFNDTQRQYLNTQFGASTIQVSSIVNVTFGLTGTRITTSTNHDFVTNDIVRIDGLQGAIQLNNNTFYVNVINATQFDLYTEPYNSDPAAVNYPVMYFDAYIGGGYVWKAYSWIIVNTKATSTSSSKLNVEISENLVPGTPVYFTEQDVTLGDQTSIPEIIAGQKYFIKEIDLAYNTVSISATLDGTALSLTDVSTCMINLTQWEQENVDRLWVTINGYRVPSSNLRLNAANEISILSEISIGDEIIITSMMPSATPNDMTYIQLVDNNNVGSVYRANSNTTTWLNKAVGEYDQSILVNDLSRITNENIQTNTAPISVLGQYIIPLDATKNDIVSVRVYNNNPARLGYISYNYISLEVTGTGPYVKIDEGSYIETGDILTITTHEGKIIYINGEYMRMTGVDPVRTTLPSGEEGYVCDVVRGVNGSMVQDYIPKFSKVYGLLLDNLMREIVYNDTWNKIPGIYNTVKGDPLQIAENRGARFLQVDV